MNSYPKIIATFLLFQFLIDTQAFAFRDFREPREREFQRREPYHRERAPTYRHDTHYNNAVKRPNVAPNSLANVHHENVSTFSQHHFTMNPHPGIPATTHPLNTTNPNTNWNNNWNNHWYNWNNWNRPWGWGNTYNFYGNGGWGWNNYWGSYDYNGLFYGALFGATLGTYLLSSNTIYNPPSYVHPATAPATPISTALPSNETWVSTANGKVPPNAVINNTENGKSTFYCRTTYMNKLTYGVLVANDGCYIETASVTMRFTTYDVLIKK